MAHPIQHGGALLERAFDAPLHLDESVARLAHFARAARMEIEIAALAERLGRAGKRQDRLDLIAAGRAIATTIKTKDVPIIHKRKIWEFEA